MTRTLWCSKSFHLHSDTRVLCLVWREKSSSTIKLLTTKFDDFVLISRVMTSERRYIKFSTFKIVFFMHSKAVISSPQSVYPTLLKLISKKSFYFGLNLHFKLQMQKMIWEGHQNYTLTHNLYSLAPQVLIFRSDLMHHEITRMEKTPLFLMRSIVFHPCHSSG